MNKGLKALERINNNNFLILQRCQGKKQLAYDINIIANELKNSIPLSKVINLLNKEIKYTCSDFSEYSKGYVDGLKNARRLIKEKFDYGKICKNSK